MSDIPLHHWFGRRRGFLERTLADLTFLLDRSYASEGRLDERSRSWLERLDPRLKFVATLGLAIHSASTQSLPVVLAIWAFATGCIVAARLPFSPVLRLWLTAGLLAALLAVPAVFLTPGKPGVGTLVATRLVARALASSTLGAALVLSTSWSHVLKAMRRLGVPVVAVALIGMSYRYIVVFLQTAVELIHARRSRTAGRLPGAVSRRLAVSSAGVLLEKAFFLSSEVHLAMQARGYRGELTILDEFCLRRRDWIAIGGLLAVEAALLAVTLTTR